MLASAGLLPEIAAQPRQSQSLTSRCQKLRWLNADVSSVNARPLVGVCVKYSNMKFCGAHDVGLRSG